VSSLRSSRHTVAPEIDQPDVISPSLPEIGELSESVRHDERGIIAAQLLWRYRSFVRAVVLRGAVLFVISALLLPKTYESTTQLMPPDRQAGGAMALISGLSAGAAGSGAASGMLSMVPDLLGMQTSGQLFVGVLKSEAVQDRLIDRFDLRKLYWVSTYRAARKILKSRSDIEEDRKSGIISITVQDRDPERAAAIARAYVAELDTLVAELNTGAAHRERVFLEDRLKVVKKELDQTALDFSKFASQNTAIDIPEQGKAMVTAAAVLQGQLIAAQAELEGLSQIYTESNVRVRSLRARVEELKRQLDKVGGAPSAGSDDLYPSIRQLPVLGVPWTDYYRRLKVNEAVFEALTKEYEVARVQEAKEIPTVKVLEVAKPPERRSGPHRALIVLAGLFLSFCAAGAWLFAREGWNNMDPEDSRKILLQDIADTIKGSKAWKKAHAVCAHWTPDWLLPRLDTNVGRQTESEI
jgi:capsule polysaccharide export protein KpsE/RkpR